MIAAKRILRQAMRKHRHDPEYWEARKPMPQFSRLVQVGPEYRDVSANDVVKVLNFQFEKDCQ